MRLPCAALAVALAWLTAACAPAPGQASSQQTPAEAGQPAKGIVDYSCSSDAQCTIKNVGNCCGEHPACVNVDSPTFPEQVKADCEAEGRSGICGFPVLEGCQCVQGHCEGVLATEPKLQETGIQ